MKQELIHEIQYWKEKAPIGSAFRDCLIILEGSAINKLEKEKEHIKLAHCRGLKDLNYWKNNAEEDYLTTPISVLRYISELEKLIPIELPSDEDIKKEAYKYTESAPDNDPVRIMAFLACAKWMKEQILK